jgi:hypothetical protein
VGGVGAQERFDDRPQLVGDEPINESSHDRESCQTDPEGAKRRLMLPLVGARLLQYRTNLAISLVTSAKGQDLFYGESFLFGRPGNFQTWILSVSGAGCLSDREGEQTANLFLDDGGHQPTYFDDQSGRPDREKIESLRRNLRINTYTVTAPFLEPSFINSQFGIGASDYYVDTVTRRYAQPPNGTRC